MEFDELRLKGKTPDFYRDFGMKAGIWIAKMPKPFASNYFYFSILGSETVNVVPFPNSVSNVIVPL